MSHEFTLRKLSRSLSELDCQHRDRATIYALHWKRNPFALYCRSEHVKQRQIMLRSRNRERGIPAPRRKVGGRRVLASHDELACSCFETHSPFVRLGGVSTPRIRVEVVYNVAAAHDQNVLMAQRAQPPSDVVMKSGWLRFIDAELYHRYVRRGERVAQHGPRSMIETPRLIQRDVQRGEQLSDSVRNLGCPRSRIPHLIQFARETAEVMDRARRTHRRYRSDRNKPVRGDRQDHTRPRNPGANGDPCRSVFVLRQRVHGIPMAKEDSRHAHDEGLLLLEPRTRRTARFECVNILVDIGYRM